MFSETLFLFFISFFIVLVNTFIPNNACNLLNQVYALWMIYRLDFIQTESVLHVELHKDLFIFFLARGFV